MKKFKTLFMSLVLGITMVGCGSKVSDSEILTTVNGSEITVGEYRKTLAIYKQSVELMYGPSVWEQEVAEGVKYEDEFKATILDQIIDSRVIYQQAEKEDLLPTDEELENSFKELKEEISKDETYEEKLKDDGVDDEYLKNQEKIDLAVANYGDFFEKNTKIDEKDIKKYYEDNKKEFYKDELQASHILVSTLDDNNKPVSEKKKKEAYEKAEEILENAKKPDAEFAELAKEHSDDANSAIKGGDLGKFSKGVMVKEFEDAAYDLEVGEISEIVETEYGYHIIKLTSKIDEQLPYEEVKESIKQKLLFDKYLAFIKDTVEKSDISTNEELIKDIEL